MDLNNELNNLVHLVCIKEGSKLRIKMKSLNYLTNSNCRFPRDLRIEGMSYYVTPDCVTLNRSRNTFFYMVNKHGIKYSVMDNEINNIHTGGDINRIGKIFEDENDPLCIVCLDNNKEMVIAPCGHYNTCAVCVARLDKCPLCRGNIEYYINRRELNTSDD